MELTSILKKIYDNQENYLLKDGELTKVVVDGKDYYINAVKDEVIGYFILEGNEGYWGHQFMQQAGNSYRSVDQIFAYYQGYVIYYLNDENKQQYYEEEFDLGDNYPYAHIMYKKRLQSFEIPSSLQYEKIVKILKEYDLAMQSYQKSDLLVDFGMEEYLHYEEGKVEAKERPEIYELQVDHPDFFHQLEANKRKAYTLEIVSHFYTHQQKLQMRISLFQNDAIKLFEIPQDNQKVIFDILKKYVNQHQLPKKILTNDIFIYGCLLSICDELGIFLKLDECVKSLEYLNNQQQQECCGGDSCCCQA